SGCQDTGVSCHQLSHRCSSPQWEEILSRYCPATCGKCRTPSTVSSSGSPCVDRTSACLLLSHRCSDPLYSPIMNAHCPSTCGKCAASAAICSDIAHNCAILVHRCYDEKYGTMMNNYCRKTCGLCTGSDGVSTNEIFARPEKMKEVFPWTETPSTTPSTYATFRYTTQEPEEAEDESIDKVMEGASDIVRLILGWRKRLNQ
ncbi:hypothetical protein PENTCL1PPCAC_2117, partial [Pristionchus entomophagus]